MVKMNIFSILFVVSTVNIFSAKNCCCKSGCCCKKCGKKGSSTQKGDERTRSGSSTPDLSKLGDLSNLQNLSNTQATDLATNPVTNQPTVEETNQETNPTIGQPTDTDINILQNQSPQVTNPGAGVNPQFQNINTNPPIGTVPIPNANFNNTSPTTNTNTNNMFNNNTGNFLNNNFNVNANTNNINNANTNTNNAGNIKQFPFSLVGLENIGATCYMNATLQCFVHNKKLLSYFKNKYGKCREIYKKPVNVDEYKLSDAFKVLIDNLYKEENGVEKYRYPGNEPEELKTQNYAPGPFKNVLGETNPLFKDIAANDAKDLVNHLILTFHDELHRPSKLFYVSKGPMDQRNKNLVLGNFVNDFKNKNQSIISDLFYAMNCNVTHCGGCNTEIYNFSTYFFLVFPLEEVRKYRSTCYDEHTCYIANMKKLISQYYCNNHYLCNHVTTATRVYYNVADSNSVLRHHNYLYKNNYPYRNDWLKNCNPYLQRVFDVASRYDINKPNEVDIYDCFEYDRKVNCMSGENSMYCNHCKDTCSCFMQTVLSTGPEVLVLLLNRGKGLEFDVKCNFVEYLDLSNYIDFKNTGYQYELVGVITHIGENGGGGHFIAYCKDTDGKKWYKFNDAIVSEVKNYKNEVIDFAVPYLLFYQKLPENKS